MTSAPTSPNRQVAIGPAQPFVRSTTRKGLVMVVLLVKKDLRFWCRGEALPRPPLGDPPGRPYGCTLFLVYTIPASRIRCTSVFVYPSLPHKTSSVCSPNNGARRSG